MISRIRKSKTVIIKAPECFDGTKTGNIPKSCFNPNFNLNSQVRMTNIN